VIRAQSTRAPNINELYSPPSQNFPTGINDPCLGVTATNTTPYSAACRAAPGVNANIATNGVFTLNQADIQGISGFDRGNPNAKQEIGHSWTAGMVITPDNIAVLKNFSFTIDYFAIQVDDALVSTDRQFILDQCYTGNSTYCQFVTRRPAQAGSNSSGSISFLDSGVTNSGGLVTEGVDVTVHYNQDLKDWGLGGNFLASLSYTHVASGYVIPQPGEKHNPFAGEVGAPTDSAYLALGYNIGNFHFNWQMSYIGPVSLDDTFLAGYDDANGNPLLPGSYGVGSVVYHDMQLGYTWNKVDFYAGAKNVFDKQPPPIISGLPGDDTGTETNAGSYDAIGRRIYAGVRIKF
jgi:hypothetical protein